MVGNPPHVRHFVGSSPLYELPFMVRLAVAVVANHLHVVKSTSNSQRTLQLLQELATNSQRTLQSNNPYGSISDKQGIHLLTFVSVLWVSIDRWTVYCVYLRLPAANGLDDVTHFKERNYM